MQAPKKYMFPHEVFNELSNINSFHDRVAYLQEHQSYSIRTIIQANFNPHIQFDLPYGSPPFNGDDMPPENSLGRIDKQIKVLGSLIIQGNPSVGLERIRKETKFLQLIESINRKDADIIIAMKDKKLEEAFPILDRTLAKAAFPDMVD